jgi:signal transduction histidine kinase
MEKDNISCQKKLGQILVEEGRVKNSDIQNALSLQKENSEHQLLGVILLKMNLITKAELSAALNKQIESSGYEEKSGDDVSDDEGIKMIVNKYKETEYFNDLHELMGIVTHKVRNPLAGISAAVEVLRERVGKDDSNERFFEMIFKEVDRLENIVKDLFKTFSNK